MARSLHLASGQHGVLGGNVVSLAMERIRQGLGSCWLVLMEEKPSMEMKIIVLASRWRRGLVMSRLVIKVGVIILDEGTQS